MPKSIECDKCGENTMPCACGRNAIFENPVKIPDVFALMMERDALAQALAELVELKKIKTKDSECPYYKNRKNLAWEAAKQVLDTLEH